MAEPRKLFWLGQHATQRPWGAPVSKVHPAGLSLLKSLGWEQVPNDTPHLPVFAFTSRKGANYPADQPGLPPVRQFPHQHTACLDDKRQLQQHLQAAAAGAGQQQQLMPRSWDTLDAYSSWLEQQQRQEPQHLQQQQQPEPQQQLPSTVFLKHRRGVKGQAVYVAHTTADLQALRQRLKSNAADFVVQEEVAPPMLLQGRKFVLRVHALVCLQQQQQQQPGRAAADEPSQEAPAGCAPQPQDRSSPVLDVYVHDDVIVLPHACLYDAHSSTPAVHVSSKGAGHPPPFLLREGLPALHAQVWPQLQQRLVPATVAAVAAALLPEAAVHPGVVLYHLFGFDCMLDAAGRLLLLEVNSYPAVASGTMSAVDPAVYTRLLRDLVTLLVLPLTDGLEPLLGGFVLCSLTAADEA